MEQVKKLSASLVKQATEESDRWDFNDLDTSSIQRERGKGKGKSRAKTPVGTCPKCGGKVITKGKFYGCSEYSKTKCSFSISKKILSKTIPQAQVKKLLKDGRTDRIDGFKKGEKEFSAYLGWDPQARNIQFLFDVE